MLPRESESRNEDTKAVGPDMNCCVSSRVVSEECEALRDGSSRCWSVLMALRGLPLTNHGFYGSNTITRTPHSLME